MKEKYLVFAHKLTTEDVDNSDATVQTTTSLVDPVSLLNETSGTDGIIEVQLKAHANHTWGSAYGTVNAGTYYTINTSGYTIGASNGIITITPASGGGSDSVNGVTIDADANNNDFRINLLKHIDGGTYSAFPASKFKGMQTVNATKTDLYFEASSGDIDDVDVIEIEHGSGKHLEVVKMVNDAMSSSKGGSVIDFFVGGSTATTGTIIDPVVFNNNPAGIVNIAMTLDS